MARGCTCMHARRLQLCAPSTYLMHFHSAKPVAVLERARARSRSARTIRESLGGTASGERVRASERERERERELSADLEIESAKSFSVSRGAISERCARHAASARDKQNPIRRARRFVNRVVNREDTAKRIPSLSRELIGNRCVGLGRHYCPPRNR